MTLSTAQRTAIFGPLVTYPNGHKGTAPENLVTVTTPWGLKVRIHRLIESPYLAACERAARECTWRPKRIDSFNPRPIRGSKAISLHALGLATDSFATPPGVEPPGGVWTPINAVPPDFARCFTDLGFRWGATFDRVDVPHIEWADGPPGPTPAPPVASGGSLSMWNPTKPGRRDLVHTDANQGVVHRWVTGWPLGKWSTESLGGRIVRDLAAGYSPEGRFLSITGTGSDGALYENLHDFTTGKWTGWQKVGG